MSKNDKYICKICNYETNRLSSYNIHLTRNKHIKNTRKLENIKMSITKFKPKDINISIMPGEIKPYNSDATKRFLDKIDAEMTKLREENLELKTNKSTPLLLETNPDFISVFDNDFDKLFSLKID